MKNNNKIQVLVAIISSLCAFVLILYISFMPYALNRKLYSKFYASTNAVQHSNFSMPTLEVLIDRTLAYSYGSISEFQTSVIDLDGQSVLAFTPKEVSHMQDVQNLFIKGRLLVVCCLALFIGTVGYLVVKRRQIRPKTIKAMLIVFSVLLLAMIILLLIATLDFNAAFTTFHKIFFTNDNWLLSYDDTLIILMPEDAFFGVVIRTIITFVVITTGLYISLILAHRKLKKTANLN